MKGPANKGGKDTVTAFETARRLEAVMKYVELDSVREFAEFIGCKRSQVSNWLQGYHFPRVPDMSTLCEKLNNEVTLDWIYRGVQTGMPYALTIHLQGLLEGIRGPAVSHEPPAPPSVNAIAKGSVAARPVQKTQARQKATQ